MLKQIYIKNFKCFDEFILQLKHVNVLSGVNGMGKSTIIQSLLLLQQSFQNDNRMNGLYLNGKYIHLGNGQDILHERAEDEWIELGYTDETGNHIWKYLYLPEWDVLPVIESSTADTQSDLFHACFSYLSAYRIEPEDLYRIQNEKALRFREFGNNGEYSIQYLGVYGDEKIENSHIILEDKAGDSLRNQTRLWLDHISPGVSPIVTVNTQLRNAEIRYEFIEGREKTRSYKSINVGFGITYVLPLVIALLSAKKGDMVIIENPEAHIHPAGQRMLGEMISRAGAGGVQIIIETHSDHILNGIRLAVKNQMIASEDVEISFLVKDKTDDYRHKCIHPKILQDGRLDSWPEGFFDEWDKALYELI